MFLLTREEGARWAKELGLASAALLQESRDEQIPGSIRVEFERSPISRYALARAIVEVIGDVPEVWLWIAQYGTWPSSENWHLYHVLRRSYGDLRRVGDAPVIQFFGHERAELTSFLDLALSFGWGGHVYSSPLWTKIGFSHDGWLLIEKHPTPELAAQRFSEMRLPVDLRAGGRKQ